MKTYVPGYILKGVTTTTKHGKVTTSVAYNKDYLRPYPYQPVLSISSVRACITHPFI